MFENFRAKNTQISNNLGVKIQNRGKWTVNIEYLDYKLFSE